MMCDVLCAASTNLLTWVTTVNAAFVNGERRRHGVLQRAGQSGGHAQYAPGSHLDGRSHHHPDNDRDGTRR